MYFIKIATLLTLALISIILSASDSSAFSRTQAQSIFKQSIAELKIPGGVMMVQTPEGKRWTVYAGVRSIHTGRPMDRNLKFRIGSITKTFVASLILMLVDEGKLSLDSRVNEILPEMMDSDNGITVRHLLQMRSNLGNFSKENSFLRDFRTKPGKKWRPEQLLSFRRKWSNAAGDRFEYNNSNYDLLGLIIEKITGTSFERLVRQRITKPLKLTFTYFPYDDSRMVGPYANGYDYNERTGRVHDLSQTVNPSWAWCSGNGVSTVPDIMIWMTEYLNGYGISKKLLKEQMTFKPTSYQDIFYGLGVMNKYGALGHNGNFAGIYTSVAYKYKNYYFVIMTNGQGYGAGKNATAESVFWDIVRKSNILEE